MYSYLPHFNFSNFWNAWAMLKARVMAWRLLWNRLRMKDNVGKRIPLHEDERSCGSCGQVRETAAHAFLDYVVATSVWNHLIEWLGTSWVAPHSIEDHFLSFAVLFRGKRCKRILRGLWICTVWVIWKWRKEVVFGGKELVKNRILEEIKCHF